MIPLRGKRKRADALVTSDAAVRKGKSDIQRDYGVQTVQNFKVLFHSFIFTL